MRDGITQFDTDTSDGRTTLVGLTDIGDWKWLACLDSPEEIESWCKRGSEQGSAFRQWFIVKGLLVA